jgi:hypothetical protein
MPTLRQWAGDNLLGVYPSGSFRKGTAVHSGTDIDLLLSLSEYTSATLKEVYNNLFGCLTSAGYSPRRQNVSLNIKVSSYSVDLVPAKRQNALSSDHSLYRRKADTWTKTNISTHARTVVGAGRADEIRILKLWRNQKGLDFPSFYLELSVIRALAARPVPGLLSINLPTLAQRVMAVFDYLRDSFPAARIADRQTATTSFRRISRHRKKQKSAPPPKLREPHPGRTLCNEL